MIFSSSLSPAFPCAATMPSSAKCARKALISWVRCRIKRSRARCSIKRPCCSADLTCTKRMVGASHRLTDRLGVSGIILVALDVGLHILRWHQPYQVAKLREFTRPIMGRRAGFHANQASRQRLEELHHLAASQLLANDDLLGCVDRMNLIHVLSDIQTDRCNLHGVAP